MNSKIPVAYEVSCGIVVWQFGNSRGWLYPRLMEVVVMSKVCDFCGKHAVAGRSISHSHRTVTRTFKPNIQRVTVVVDGQRKKMNVCSRCLKSGKIARS